MGASVKNQVSQLRMEIIVNKLKLSHKLYLGFAIVIILMIGILGYTYINYDNETKAVELNLNSYVIIDEANAMLISLLNMETGARGYAIAGKDEFLRPFHQGEKDFLEHFNTIKELTSDNIVQQNRLTSLLKQYESWYDWETTKIIEGRRLVLDGKLAMEDVIALVQTDRGKNEMDIVRTMLSEIIKEEQQTLDMRYTNLKTAEERTGLVIVMGGLFTVIVSSFIALYTSLSVSKPVNMLINASENITEQNYQELIDLKTDKEFDALIKHFNDMQAAIQSREFELNNKNQELKIQMANVNEANKLKSQFLANMSHELRTPLNSIIGFTNRVIKKSGDQLPLIQQENLNIVLGEAHHLLELINSLLDYSKIEAGKMELHIERFDLLKVMEEVYTMTRTLSDGKIINYKQDFYTLDNMPIVNDRLKVKQILINLLSNAFKYSEEGTITFSVNKEDNFYCIKVKDEGIGIAAGDINYIFDEFRQVDGTYTRKVGGTGLGLSITKKFVEMLGGEITVKSEYGVGSCFTVILPIDIEVKHKNVLLGDEIQVKHKRKVVCIDDDNNVQRLYKQYLNEYEIEAIAMSGREDVMKEILDIAPDAIVLDIMLSDKDGWEILSELKNNEETKKIPVIMASVLSEKNLAYRMKADAFLIKPVTQEELFDTITRTITKKTGLDILVADDDENFLNLIGQFLKEESIPYRCARNGEEVIHEMINKKPDLLILDIMMPKKDGFTVLEDIRKRVQIKDTPVIVVTSKDLTNEEKDALRKSTSAVIHKSAVMMDIVMENLIKRIKENLNNA
jgi:signal transduction histidine kinase/DNA-binding response OmpR family regulator